MIFEPRCKPDDAKSPLKRKDELDDDVGSGLRAPKQVV
jgi:hypothetical protein